MVHFPPGVSIIGSDGTKSCVEYCAYHGAFTHKGQNVYYAVIPDQGGNCATGCGDDKDPFNNTTSVSSHELAEAVTDAAFGITTKFAAPLAWYDQTFGEIGDICNNEHGAAAGYVVQKEWSNAAKSCVE
jgi:hypothetical protein